MRREIDVHLAAQRESAGSDMAAIVYLTHWGQHRLRRSLLLLSVLVVVIFAVVSGILLAHQAGTAYVLLIKKIILDGPKKLYIFQHTISLEPFQNKMKRILPACS